MKLSNRERRAIERRPISNEWQRYEQEKRAWLDRNPEATPKEREQAMLRIARRLGV